MPRNSLYPSIGGRGVASGNIDQREKGRLDGMQSFGMATMSDETREALPKALLELFHVHKVCSSVYLLAALAEAGFLIGLEWNRRVKSWRKSRVFTLRSTMEVIKKEDLSTSTGLVKLNQTAYAHYYSRSLLKNDENALSYTVIVYRLLKVHQEATFYLFPP